MGHVFLPYRAPVSAGAITYVGGDQAANWRVAANIALTLPTHQADDFMVITAVGDDANALMDFSISSATGWTELDDFADTQGARRKRLAVFYKKATSSSETNPQVAKGDSREARALLHVFRGVDTTTPFDTTYSKASHFSYEASTTTPTPPGITTTNANSALLCYLMHCDEFGSAFTPPSGYTLGQSGIGTNTSSAISYLLDAGAAGVKSPGAWSYDGSADNAYQFTFALRAA